jgi:hypothetical protein
MEEQFLELVNAYKAVIASFKNRTQVLNGQAIAWTGGTAQELFGNTPKGIGDGLGTTGWCVSASDALLNDEIFKTLLGYRNATAHLISIDLKEQYYGYCYNGSQNMWHTAIFVEDSGFNIVIDITCRQFGNQFIEKDVWDWTTWEKVLRNPNCQHKISVKVDNPDGITPAYIPLASISDLQKIDIKDAMHSVTNMDSYDRDLMGGFLLHKMGEINGKILVGNITVQDYKYIDSVSKLMQKMPFKQIKTGFTVLAFRTKNASKEWLKLFLEGKGKLPSYTIISPTVSASCRLNGYDEMDVNLSYRNAIDPSKTYVVIEFGEVFGPNVDFLKNASVLLPFGLQFPFDSENIWNGGKAIDGNIVDGKLVRETNAIYLKVGNQPY